MVKGKQTCYRNRGNSVGLTCPLGAQFSLLRFDFCSFLPLAVDMWSSECQVYSENLAMADVDHIFLDAVRRSLPARPAILVRTIVCLLSWNQLELE